MRYFFRVSALIKCAFYDLYLSYWQVSSGLELVILQRLSKSLFIWLVALYASLLLQVIVEL